MSPKILYIDDEADLLDLAQSFFAEEDLPIETCTDFNQALSLIRNNHYDLIITDVKMPSGSGYELLKIIKDEGFQGKVVLVTGNLEKTDGDCSDYGHDLVIYKPIQFQELIHQVRSLLNSEALKQ